MELYEVIMKVRGGVAVVNFVQVFAKMMLHRQLL